MSGNNGLYFLMISIHGLIRGHDMELGCDADTGGQTKYVVDLSQALSRHPDVAQVDLVTRRIVDSGIGADYSKPYEPLSEKARIVRIDAGPDEYLAKEILWDHLDIFSDNLLNWLNGQPRMPDIIHSHYADSGYVGVRLSNLLGIPLVHTGHSLGRDKRRKLLSSGLTRKDIEERYHMSRRVDAEEAVLANAELVITSTHNEIEEQYALYDYYQPARMRVIPPGTNLVQFHPPDPQTSAPPFIENISHFLNDPKKPLILALSRPDERKNLVSLVEAYGESEELQEQANLVVVAGNREDIREMDNGPQTVFTDLLLLMDYYDLYGRVAIPKHHQSDEVPAIYRMAASLKGVFVNPALTEPFGLTLLEAAASGLPVVATENGGPVDIISNCQNGILVDPLDTNALGAALLRVLKDPPLWEEYAQNGIQGVRKHYSWKMHAESYLGQIKTLLETWEVQPEPLPERRLMRYHDRAIFTGLDLSILDNPEGLPDLVKLLQSHRKSTSFGIATGRRLDSALAVLKKHNIPIPNVLVTSLGTQIHYSPGLNADGFWTEHIDHLWKPKAIQRILSDLPGLKRQPKKEQSRFKISYYYDPEKAPTVEEINALLRTKEQTANVIHSFGQYLDIVPVRASKGQALRYFAQRWEIPLQKILVVGGSGGDEDMMLGNTLAVVVANRHHEELSQLVDLERIYFSKKTHALGILEAVEYYDFFNTCRVPED